MSEIIPNWLTKQADLAPNTIAIEDLDGETITFLQLKARSMRFAKQLANLGVKAGSHIGILSNNHPDMIIALHSLTYLGAVSVMLNTRLTAAELAYQITDADVEVVLTSTALFNFVKKMDVSAQIYTFQAIKDLAEEAVALRTEIGLDDVCTIMYTSGTTGLPKGVVHTYGNHWWSAIGSALNLGLDPRDKWLAMLPIFHIGGLSIFLKSVIYGMPVLLLEKFDEKLVHKAIMQRGVTIVSVVTVMLQRLLDLMAEDERYPDAFRCMLLGGGPVPKPVLEQASIRHIPVFQSYGMTETSSQIATLGPNDAFRKLGSAGKPLFPAQLKIDGPKNEAIGEILVKGPMVTKGYFKNEIANIESYDTGWLKTGDAGYLDPEGFLYVVDRRKDLIISGGENIYPAEIENVLVGMKQVKEAGVIGVQDERWGQVPIAFVVLTEDLVTKKEIANYLEPLLAKYKQPKSIYIVDQLPRNASNKLVRSALLNCISKGKL